MKDLFQYAHRIYCVRLTTKIILLKFNFNSFLPLTQKNICSKQLHLNQIQIPSVNIYFVNKQFRITFRTMCRTIMCRTMSPLWILDFCTYIMNIINIFQYVLLLRFIQSNNEFIFNGIFNRIFVEYPEKIATHKS